eukprot:6190335-Pleurochrysis_carterae.AAC.5
MLQKQDLRPCRPLCRPQDHAKLRRTHARVIEGTLHQKRADRFLPKTTLRKQITTPAWFTSTAQRVSTFSKLSVAMTGSNSAVKHDNRA